MGRTAHLGAFAAPSRHDRTVADAALETLGIAALAARPFTEISGGERQLALIARALAQEAGLLVMDEPTASLDFGNQVRVLERIVQLAAHGIAVLFSTHDPDHAFLCAQRALLLAEGRTLALGPPREVIRSDTLEQLYRVTVRIVETEGGAHTCVPSLRRPS
jgi:iron complex transport system ATP-binding protein